MGQARPITEVSAFRRSSCHFLSSPSKLFYRNTTHLMYMKSDNTIKNLVILALAVIIVIALWKTIWYLAGVAVFILLVYIVYQLLKGKL
jgi:uncharacterized membrane protein